VSVGNAARVALGAIRLVNGLWALLLPKQMGRTIGLSPDDPGVVYPLRMFGVRTVLLGVDLLTAGEERRERALREGVAIHLSDAATAATAGIRGDLRPRSAIAATAISTVNTCLAIVGLARR
jgi:hypothetical protein